MCSQSASTTSIDGCVRNDMRVKVECYAGHRGDEKPQRFEMDGKSVEVQEILDQWQGTDYRYFKLRGEDGNLYILRHDEAAARWEIHLFRTPRGEAVSQLPQGWQLAATQRGKPH